MGDLVDVAADGGVVDEIAVLFGALLHVGDGVAAEDTAREQAGEELGAGRVGTVGFADMWGGAHNDSSVVADTDDSLARRRFPT